MEAKFGHSKHKKVHIIPNGSEIWTLRQSINKIHIIRNELWGGWGRTAEYTLFDHKRN
jgi:hypothetical protein